MCERKLSDVCEIHVRYTEVTVTLTHVITASTIVDCIDIVHVSHFFTMHVCQAIAGCSVRRCYGQWDYPPVYVSLPGVSHW